MSLAVTELILDQDGKAVDVSVGEVDGCPADIWTRTVDGGSHRACMGEKRIAGGGERGAGGGAPGWTEGQGGQRGPQRGKNRCDYIDDKSNDKPPVAVLGMPSQSPTRIATPPLLIFGRRRPPPLHSSSSIPADLCYWPLDAASALGHGIEPPHQISSGVWGQVGERVDGYGR